MTSIYTKIFFLILFSFYLKSQNTIANFQIDGNLAATSTNNDWFAYPGHSNSAPGVGIGLLDTTGTAQIKTLLGTNPNITFRKKGILGYLKTITGASTYVDALFGKDYYGGAGYLDSSSYVIASKNGEAPSQWHPGVANVSGKNDILDIYAYSQRDSMLGDGKDTLYVFMGVSLNTNTGARYVDFEFYQGDVEYYPQIFAFSDGDVQEEGHKAFLFDNTGKITQYGDLIVSVEIGSSGIQTFEVRIWMEKAKFNSFKSSPPANLPFRMGAAIDGASTRSVYGYGTVIPKNGASYSAYAATNVAPTPAPPWGTLVAGAVSDNYAINQFFELAVNLTQLGLDPDDVDTDVEDPCARSFYKYMVKSRASNAFTAQLKDFSGPFDFGGGEDPGLVLTSLNTVITCESANIPIQAIFTNPDVSSKDYYFKWYRDGVEISNISGFDSTQYVATQSGWYKVEVSTNTNCLNALSVDSIRIFQDNINPPNPTVQNDSICPGSPSKALMVTDPGSLFQVRWYDASTEGNLLATGVQYLPPAPGTFYVETTKISSGCKSMRVPVTLSVITDVPVIATPDITKPCPGQNNGQINNTITGGKAPLAFLWSNGATTEDLSSIGKGTYSFRVTDGNGCTDTELITVNETTPIVTAPAITHVACFGESTGAITLNATGGEGTKVYSWSPSASTENLTGISAGTYRVTVTDAAGCTKIDSARVNQPSAALAIGTPTQVNVLCKDSLTGSIVLNPTGGTPGYTYSWNGTPGSKDTFGLADGIYNITVTDANNCMASTSVTISEPTAVTATLASDSVLCHGESTGKIWVTPSGGISPYTYLWSTGGRGDTLRNVPAGTYTVTVTDANNCPKVVTGMVGQPTAPLDVSLASGLTTDSVACFGGTTGKIRLTVTGGTEDYTYLWSDNSTLANLENIAAGSYSLKVTDRRGCMVTKNYVVSQPPPLIISPVVDNATCSDDSDGSISITVSGGNPSYSFAWTGPSSYTSPQEDISGLLVGTYTVTVTDSKSCTATSTSIVGSDKMDPATPTSIKYN
jgi:hypothetical protein